MPEEKMIHSHSEKLSVSDIRKLREVAKVMDLQLNQTEFVKIMLVYGECVDRLLKENGEEV